MILLWACGVEATQRCHEIGIIISTLNDLEERKTKTNRGIEYVGRYSSNAC